MALFQILDSSDITQAIQSKAAHVGGEVTGLSTNACRTLLRQFKWDEQRLLEKWVLSLAFSPSAPINQEPIKSLSLMVQLLRRVCALCEVLPCCRADGCEQ